MTAPARLLFLHAREDEERLRALKKHLASLRHEGFLESWDEGDLLGGSEIRAAMEQQLATANVVVFLLSSDFIGSERYPPLVDWVLKQQAARHLLLIPVVVRAVEWRTGPLGQLPALPRNGRPVMNWSTKDEAWLDVAQGIRSLLRSDLGINDCPPSDFEAAVQRHCHEVAEEYLYSDHRGISGAGRHDQAASLEFDDVYVLPELLPDRELWGERERAQRLRKALDSGGLAPDEQRRLEEEYRLLTESRWRQAASRRKAEEQHRSEPLGEVLQRQRHLVVIGSPGLGKSALVRFLARLFGRGPEAVNERFGWSENLTPLVLPLGAFADARQKDPALSVRDALLNRALRTVGQEVERSLCRAALEERLDRGGAFILLDGIDEVPESVQRTSVVRAIDEFLRIHPSCRCLVTSRPYGYVRLAGQLAHYHIPHMPREQVGEFVKRWQLAIERLRHPLATAEAQRAAAEREAEAMLREIRSSPRVAELATIPLMLVIIALIRHDNDSLPDKRIQLYHDAVRTLTDTWNRLRSLASESSGRTELPLERLLPVLRAVAAWTRAERPTGIIHRGDLQRKLTELLTEQMEVEDPERIAESYLDAAAGRAGLLEERGRDVFAFWHPTFEEFLAAMELSTPSAGAAEKLLPRRDDPRWREVILLAVAYLCVVVHDIDTASTLVTDLATRDSAPLPHELRSHLCLAAASVVENPTIRRSAAEAILRQLTQAVTALPYEPLLGAFRALARSRVWRPGEETVEALGTLAEQCLVPTRSRLVACQLLGGVIRTSPAARCVCERLLGNRTAAIRLAATILRALEGPLRQELPLLDDDFREDVVNEEEMQELLESRHELVVALEEQLDDGDLTRRLDAIELLRLSPVTARL